MARQSLEDVTATLDRGTVASLGDTFVWTPQGGGAETIKGFVDHRDRTRDFSGAQIVAQDIVIELYRPDVEGMARGDAIALPKTGLGYIIKDMLTETDGDMVSVLLKLAR